MKVIDQSFKVETSVEDLVDLPEKIEKAARTCYKSEDKITSGSAAEMCRKLIARGHEAMLEHGSITIRFITDRGVTHELVRHRLASYAQESTRYCNYGDQAIEFIRPLFPWSVDAVKPSSHKKFMVWRNSMLYSEASYKEMLALGCSPQEARSVLPNSLKTEIVVTANIREWRAIFRLRCAKPAHPQIRGLMVGALEYLKEFIPELFDDISYYSD